MVLGQLLARFGPQELPRGGEEDAACLSARLAAPGPRWCKPAGGRAALQDVGVVDPAGQGAAVLGRGTRWPKLPGQGGLACSGRACRRPCPFGSQAPEGAWPPQKLGPRTGQAPDRPSQGPGLAPLEVKPSNGQSLCRPEATRHHALQKIAVAGAGWCHGNSGVARSKTSAALQWVATRGKASRQCQTGAHTHK